MTFFAFFWTGKDGLVYEKKLQNTTACSYITSKSNGRPLPFPSLTLAYLNLSLRCL